MAPELFKRCARTSPSEKVGTSHQAKTAPPAPSEATVGNSAVSSSVTRFPAADHPPGRIPEPFKRVARMAGSALKSCQTTIAPPEPSLTSELDPETTPPKGGVTSMPDAPHGTAPAEVTRFTTTLLPESVWMATIAPPEPSLTIDSTMPPELYAVTGEPHRSVPLPLMRIAFTVDVLSHQKMMAPPAPSATIAGYSCEAEPVATATPFAAHCFTPDEFSFCA